MDFRSFASTSIIIFLYNSKIAIIRTSKDFEPFCMEK